MSGPALATTTSAALCGLESRLGDASELELLLLLLLLLVFLLRLEVGRSFLGTGDTSGSSALTG